MPMFLLHVPCSLLAERAPRSRSRRLTPRRRTAPRRGSALARTLSCLLLVAGLLAAPAAEAGRREKRLARKHYAAGQKAYEAGNYERAAEQFRTGYRYLEKPAFLINIAQSYRKAGDLDRAIEYYETYLERAPKGARLRVQVQELLKELHAEKAAEAAAADAADPADPGQAEPGGASAPPEAVAVAPPPPMQHSAAPSPFYKKWWFWTGVAAVVGAGVGVGVYMGTREAGYVEQGELGQVAW